MKHKLAIIPVLIAALLLSACKAPDIITLLELALQAASISGTLPPNVQAYVNASLAGIACASDEAATSDPQPVKAARITACFADAIEPFMPPGTPANVVSAVKRLSKAVADILTRTSTATVATRDVPKPDVVSVEDKAKLADIARRARAERGSARQ